MERGKEGCLGPFLIHRAAADEDLAESGPVHESGGEGRRRPFRGIGLLHVVHEVDRESLRGARVERREDARVTVGVDTRRLLEAGIARHPHHEIAALVHPTIFRGERRVLHPLLKASEALVMTLFDLGLDAA